MSLFSKGCTQVCHNFCIWLLRSASLISLYCQLQTRTGKRVIFFYPAGDCYFSVLFISDFTQLFCFIVHFLISVFHSCRCLYVAVSHLAYDFTVEWCVNIVIPSSLPFWKNQTDHHRYSVELMTGARFEPETSRVKAQAQPFTLASQGCF